VTRTLDTRTARQFWVRSPGAGEIVTAEVGPRQEGEVWVRTLYSGISRGTEALVFRGRVPESQHAAMRCPFQEGDFPAPVKYGYSSVGRVEDGPPELRGRTVFCLHPHQDLYCVPAVAVHPLPDGLPPARAILAANCETALNAVWDAGPGPCDRIAVVGAGVVGLLIAWICAQIPGTDVVVIDVNPAREAVARELGAEFSSAAPGDFEADLVMHASGSPQGLQTALDLAGVEATIVEVSWFGDRAVSLPLGEAFHSRRLTLRSSQVGRLPAGRTPRWSHRRRVTAALELLLDAAADRLITGESSFVDLPDVMRQLTEHPHGALCHRVRYSVE
jgi:NADPH:quinone reductase-like Zn-dependent oxidoreductase